MVQRLFLLPLFILFVASCGISRTSSHFSYGEGWVTADLPKKVAIHLCGTDPSVRLDVRDALVTNLSGTGIEVLEPGDSRYTAAMCEAETLPEATRKSLYDNFGIQGLFVGVLEQRRASPLLLTKFQLQLIGNPSGRPVWITNVKRDHLASLADTRITASKVAELAVDSFKKDCARKFRSEQKKHGEEKSKQ